MATQTIGKKELRQLVRQAGKKRRTRRGTGRKLLSARASRLKGLSRAFGAAPGRASGSGPGRPRGTFKYGMPIHEFKKLQAQRKALLNIYKQKQANRLAKRGFSPEQVEELQVERTIQQGLPKPTQSVPDEEVQFQEFLAKNTVSPRTQKILDDIRRVQLKGKSDNIAHQRRIHERNLVGKSMSLMKAHENMVDVRMDFTGVSSSNILMAESVFKENPENNILRPRGRNILDTGEDNTLRL